jgi:hypothetical protein
VLAPGQIAVFMDAAYSDAATFRAEWGVPAGALLVLSQANVALRDLP